MNTNDTFYQIWDTRTTTPRVIETIDTRADARSMRRKAFRKNPSLTSQDLRLVQVSYANSDAGTFRFVR